MTREHALALYDCGWWKDKSPRSICMFQLFEERLCMPFRDFHMAVEAALGRPVWTHEFTISNVESLRREFLGEQPAPSFEDICALIPEAKRIVVTI